LLLTPRKLRRNLLKLVESEFAKKFYQRRRALEQKKISVLGGAGEGKVFDECEGEKSVFGFEILQRPSERLCAQKTG
jgi:hypothetical protein